MKTYFCYVIVFLCCMILSGCGAPPIQENDELKPEGFEELIINSTGLEFNNISSLCAKAYSGRVTSQGEKTYFYETGNIYCIDSTGNKIQICSSNGAEYINVIGNKLYYLEIKDNSLWGRINVVNIDGSEKYTLIEDVVATPFIVHNNYIYCVQKVNTSATTYQYDICKYDIKEKQLNGRIHLNEIIPRLIGLGGKDGNAVIYTYTADSTTGKYYCINVICADFEGNQEFSKQYDSYGYGGTIFGGVKKIYALCRKDNLYIMKEADNSLQTIDLAQNLEISNVKIPKNCTLINFYNDDLIISKESEDGKQELYVVQGNVSLEGENFTGSLIVQEGPAFAEVYIIGDYVYYTLLYYNYSYSNANIFRIKIDGTCWEDI